MSSVILQDKTADFSSIISIIDIKSFSIIDEKYIVTNNIKNELNDIYR
jgi:hypothetical protein